MSLGVIPAATSDRILLFSWLSSSLLCIYTLSSLSFLILIDIEVVFISLLLETMMGLSPKILNSDPSSIYSPRIALVK